ncbi:type II toxin-antitoxin system VapC family toxin [Geodermatophilus sabuli]|uniref:Ribonuclease VapC n=1 Tax=Geodermatophilus sabuli TaxID=1564158 RepID=A0A285EF90_9ACTN|nr:type II toxin-antitoxin system VapC family toxin [Geodermatophilus sabuli]MBB3086678.1 putative nucleic acid-binding protein [Geodermatophilus sabuli]SNX97670.1 Predicted nucleic acid-binding protein, contains PIN domain [Geodermatophilus sabuli]
MIVVDASTVVAALLDAGSDGESAREVMLANEAHAPHLLDVEVLSAVRRHALSGRLSGAAVHGAVAALRELPVARHGHDLLLDRSLELRDSVTAYDGVYVALAEVLEAPLVTGDRRLSRTPGLRCAVSVIG